MGKFTVRFLLLLVLCIGMSAIADAAQLRRQKTPHVQSVTPVPEIVNAWGQPVEKVGDGKVRERLFLALVKHKVIAAAVKDGMKRDKAEATWDKLIKDVGVDGLMELAKEASPKLAKEVGEGGPLARLIQWIKDHPDEVLAFIKFLMTLFALFADGT